MERNNTLDLLIKEKKSMGEKIFSVNVLAVRKRHWQEELKPYNKTAANVSTWILLE